MRTDKENDVDTLANGMQQFTTDNTEPLIHSGNIESILDDEIGTAALLDGTLDTIPNTNKFDHFGVQKAIHMLIKALGDDPQRSGVVETPKRVADMYQEILNGYDEVRDIKSLVKLFDEPTGCNGMVVVKDVPFYSFCEHHMMPFFGKISIAYIPAEKKVLGISKLVRIARLFAKQLQVQERLTTQIINAISKYVPNHGVAVRIEAEHMCMSIRGVRTPGAKTVTTRLTGMFFDDPKTRNEFIDALRG